MPQDDWERVEDAAYEASYPGPEELDSNLGTPYAHCPTCNSRQEIDYALDGSGIPYCCECGQLLPGATVDWEEPDPQPLTAQERKVLVQALGDYDKALWTRDDLADYQREAIDRLLQSVWEKLKLP